MRFEKTLLADPKTAQKRGKGAGEGAVSTPRESVPLAVSDNRQSVTPLSDADLGLEREEAVNRPGAETRIPSVQEHREEKGSATLSREVMLDKSTICNTLRLKAHETLALVGGIEEALISERIQSLEKNFEARMTERMGKIKTLMDISATGPLMPVFLGLFKDYWSEQSAITRLIAYGKKDVIEHLFIFRSLSNNIEQTVIKMDVSETAEETKFYNEQLKCYLRAYIECLNKLQVSLIEDNEQNVRILNKVVGIYGEITKNAATLDRVLISEVYEEGKVPNEDLPSNQERQAQERKKQEEELELRENALHRENVLKKNRICSDIIALVSEQPAAQFTLDGSQKQIFLQEIQDIQKTTQKEKIPDLIAHARRNIWPSQGSVMGEVMKKISEIEEMFM